MNKFPPPVPRRLRNHPLALAIANAAAKPRTFEELERAKAEIEAKLCHPSKYTVQQRRAFHKEKTLLDHAILDKQIAYSFRNGYLDIVPGSPIEVKPGRWIWSQHVALRSELSNQKRYIKTNWRRGMRVMERTEGIS